MLIISLFFTWITKNEKCANSEYAGQMFGGLHGFAVHSAAIQSCLGIFKKRKEEFKCIIGFFIICFLPPMLKMVEPLGPGNWNFCTVFLSRLNNSRFK
jgi:hypothetical protein